MISKYERIVISQLITWRQEKEFVDALHRSCIPFIGLMHLQHRKEYLFYSDFTLDLIDDVDLPVMADDWILIIRKQDEEFTRLLISLMGI